MIKNLRVNNRIRIPSVQVIGENGEQLGAMDTRDALGLAREKNLDLVEVGPNMNPPIAKIMDYGRYIYQKEKQEKQTKALKQKDRNPKTVRIGFKTGGHDLKVKSQKVDKFLKEGHPVYVELFLRGREKALSYMGKGKIENFLKYITEPYITQGDVKKSPRGWNIIIKKDKK